jgi:hypothetical protein
VILRLAQRGRIAFALVNDRRDLKRAARLSVARNNEQQYRVSAGTLFAALCSAGKPLRREGVPR